MRRAAGHLRSSARVSIGAASSSKNMSLAGKSVTSTASVPASVSAKTSIECFTRVCSFAFSGSSSSFRSAESSRRWSLPLNFFRATSAACESKAQ